MTVTVYQIKNDCEYAFLPWSFAKDKFSIDDYEEVYSYFLDVRPCKENNYRILITEDEKLNHLDKIWSNLNVNIPEDFNGHSLSVSDVVELDDDMYYCDMFGWKKIGE